MEFLRKTFLQTGSIVESKGMRAIFQKKGKKRAENVKKGKKGQNISKVGKNVKNLKII